MIKEIVDEFILGHNTIITAPTGHGSTVLALHMTSLLLNKDKKVIYYNSTGDIDRDFVKKNYPSVSTDIFFHKESLSLFIDFLDYINYDVDNIVIDPGDPLMSNKNIYPLLNNILKSHSGMLVTSQIRQDPTKGGQVYSPIEELNKQHGIFKYSIWIRNVTEDEQLFKARYIDVFSNHRTGNKFLRRYIVRFDSMTGVLIE